MKLCLWADLKPEHIAALDAAVDEAGTQQVLAQALQLVPEDNPLRHSVLLEFYVNNVRFARENGFSIEKLSAFFSIMKRNHDEMVDAFLPMEKSWEHFKALLLAHAVQRPPHSVGVFTLKEAQLITDFALNTYYRHFKLFRYAFTMRHEKSITTRTCLTELPPTSFYPLVDGNCVEAEPEEEAAEEAPPPPEMPEVQLDVDVPDDVKRAVEEQIAAQVSAMRAMLESQYAERFARHEAKISALEDHFRITKSGKELVGKPYGEAAEGMDECKAADMATLEAEIFKAVSEKSGKKEFTFNNAQVTPKESLWTACIDVTI